MEGLSLDQAIDRLVNTNLDLRAKALEIPKAQAAILTASLRANPILYADTQLVPYGSYSAQRPGGQTQYDINITHPLDLSHKRQARTIVATQAKRVIEAQYQDAVRQQIDNLYTAFVDVLAERETVLYTKASMAGLREVLGTTQALEKQGVKTLADVNRIKVQLDNAELADVEAEGRLLDAKRNLAALLNIPPLESEELQVRGALRDTGEVMPPPVDELINLALRVRPDLVSFRLDIRRAEADVVLAKRNRFEDVYVLWQPYTFQNNAPFGTKSATSWALGVTVPLPVYNRNQANILQARLNVTQVQIALADLERRTIAEVKNAERSYRTSRASVIRYETDILQEAKLTRDKILQLYSAGEVDLIVYLDAQREYNDVVRIYRDTLIRHRRSMLDLNTAVGQRILP